MDARHRNGGLRKRCGCPRRDWSKCQHSWHLNFQWEGQHYRLSLDREVGRGLLGKTDAKATADQICAAIREGTFQPRRGRVRARQVEAPTQVPQLTFAKFSDLFVERYSKARGKKSAEDDEYKLKAVGAFNALGDKPVALMRGHGDVVVGPNVRVATARAVFTDENARMLAVALSFGGPVNYVSPGEGALRDKDPSDATRSWELWKATAMRKQQ